MEGNRTTHTTPGSVSLATSTGGMGPMDGKGSELETSYSTSVSASTGGMGPMDVSGFVLAHSGLISISARYGKTKGTRQGPMVAHAAHGASH